MIIGMATSRVYNRFILHIVQIPWSQTDKQSLLVRLENNLYYMITINTVKSFVLVILNDSIKLNALMIVTKTQVWLLYTFFMS